MFAASEPIAGADTPLNIVLGTGVLLLFAGILIRALASRRHDHAGVAPLRGLLRAIPRRTAASPDRAPRAAPAARDPGVDAPPAQIRASRPRPPEPAAAPRLRTPGEHARVDAGTPTSPSAMPDVGEPELTRLSRATLERLGRTLDESRRLRVAEERVAEELAALPEGFWLVERDVRLGVRRIPFLVMGATGVFAICPTDGAWTLHDLHVLSELGDGVRRQLPGYDGPVRAAVCLAFDEMKPRAWFGGQGERGRGGWVLGLDWLASWMFSFGPEHGLGNGDVRRLDEASGPFWDRRSTARLPASRNVG
jgi:hypothetical protein